MQRTMLPTCRGELPSPLDAGVATRREGHDWTIESIP